MSNSYSDTQTNSPHASESSTLISKPVHEVQLTVTPGKASVPPQASEDDDDEDGEKAQPLSPEEAQAAADAEEEEKKKRELLASIKNKDDAFTKVSAEEVAKKLGTDLKTVRTPRNMFPAHVSCFAIALNVSFLYNARETNGSLLVASNSTALSSF